MKPILFNAEMVRAILAGRKTQTRRVVKQTDSGYAKEPNGHRRWHLGDPDAVLASPLGQVGDRLWVRETFIQGWKYENDIPDQYNEDGSEKPMHTWYRATDGDISWYTDDEMRDSPPWKPSIHMPKSASRITLEITGVRIERLQDITDADAEAEGVDFLRQVPDADETLTASQLFMCLWDSIYKNWNSNPWVWVYEFKRVES